MEVVGKVSAVAPATIEMTAGTIQHVTLGEFMELAKQEGSLILDARPQVFYRSGNIPGAI